MVSTIVLLALLLVATYTDIRWRIVANWTTYAGALAALAANGTATLMGLDVEADLNAWYGVIGFHDSILGLLGCGFVMLVCYVFFPGGVGGGDVKLIAMMGAFLGPYLGLEAMLWTFVLGGCSAIIVLIWRFGLFHLLGRALQMLGQLIRFRLLAPLKDEERAALKTDVYLAPSALAAVIIIQLRLIGWF
jgi:prepilin peptidase CpaA